MAYIWRTYRCSGDEDAEPHEFRIMIASGEHPRFCAVCGAEFEGEPDVVPGGGHIGGSAITRTVDKMYRDIETGSAERAALAGSPALKVTDMKDHLREGDVAVEMPSNTVTQYMEAAAPAGARYGFGGGAMTGVSFQSAPNAVPTNTITGPGHAALWGVQGNAGQTHAARAQEMTAAGQQGTDRRS